MNTQITGHNIELTQALREKIQEKLNKHLKTFEKVITTVRIILDVVKSQHQIEGIVHIPHQDIHAKAEASDMYEALDQLIDKLVRQLKKHKEMIKDHHRG